MPAITKAPSRSHTDTASVAPQSRTVEPRGWVRAERRGGAAPPVDPTRGSDRNRAARLGHSVDTVVRAVQRGLQRMPHGATTIVQCYRGPTQVGYGSEQAAAVRQDREANEAWDPEYTLASLALGGGAPGVYRSGAVHAEIIAVGSAARDLGVESANASELLPAFRRADRGRAVLYTERVPCTNARIDGLGVGCQNNLNQALRADDEVYYTFDTNEAMAEELEYRFRDQLLRQEDERQRRREEQFERDYQIMLEIEREEAARQAQLGGGEAIDAQDQAMDESQDLGSLDAEEESEEEDPAAEAQRHLQQLMELGAVQPDQEAARAQQIQVDFYGDLIANGIFAQIPEYRGFDAHASFGDYVRHVIQLRQRYL